MEDTDNKSVMDFKSTMGERMKNRYPDRSLIGQDGQYDQNSLEQAIIDAFDEDAQRIGSLTELEEKTNLLNKLFLKSPKAATFMSALAEGMDPASAVYKAWGKKAFDAFNEGDASAYIAEIERANSEALARDEALNKEREDNFNKSMETLQSFADSKGLDEQQATDLFMKVYNYACDATMGIYPTELFEMAWKSSRYDEDVATARREGEVTGRNAKIEEMRIKRNQNASMPPSFSGQGTPSQERRPKKEDNPWML